MCDLSLNYSLRRKLCLKVIYQHQTTVLTKTQSIVIQNVGCTNVAGASAVRPNVVSSKVDRTIFIEAIKFKSNLQHRLLECVDGTSSSI